MGIRMDRAVTSIIATCLLLLAIPGNAWPASKAEVDARVKSAMQKLYIDSPEARELAAKAAGILVFPRVYKVGFGFGGKFGEGALLINKATAQYYRVASGSIGFQVGAKARSEVLMFMTATALQAFRQSDGWEAGVDGSVAIVQFGVGESIDTHSGQDPIIGFVFGNKGLMYDLSLEGTKYWQTQK